MKSLWVEYTRGPKVESRHRVDALWMDSQGRLIESWGDEEKLVCPRSSLKPLQALPFVLSKAYEKSPDPWKAIAIACASHKADEIHLRFVEKWLEQMGMQPENLVCGVQPPEQFERVKIFFEGSRKLSQIFNNCSGKHSSMIATCLVKGWDHRNYHAWDHPLQMQIRSLCRELSDIDWDHAPAGVDGCGLPNYFVPLIAFARALSKFLEPEKSPYGDAMKKILEAWRREPEMIAGEGDLATELSKITQGRVAAKIGAQGNFMALDPHRGRCLVLKVEDGAARAAEEALISLLHVAGSITAPEVNQLRQFVSREIRNWAGEVVGHAQVHFTTAD